MRIAAASAAVALVLMVRHVRHRAAGGARSRGAGVTLRLPFVPPYDWAAMTAFLGTRAIPGVEAVEGDSYRRSFALAGAEGVVEVRPGRTDGLLLATVWTSDQRAVAPVVARLRRLFDLDADTAAIDAHLARDPALAGRVRARPGLRVPRAWDAFELAVRALLGQQITVAGARTLAGRLVARLGRPHAAPDGAPADVPLLFPGPQAVAAAALEPLGLPRARAAALRALAGAVAAQPDLLRPAATLEETVARLDALPGVGPWTAHYIAMRALGEADAFPAADLGLLRAMATPAGRPTPARLAARAESWRPWRAYAAVRLWLQPAAEPQGSPAGAPPD
ncbi:MAG: DNA-3-methyladenine glycosylase 2 family protein, partial [Rhodospirillaceae bacterium]|nr:DNA-3-methyladenine glycosylase 2 family protein [Rhodospirillaceae bacterium]